MIWGLLTILAAFGQASKDALAKKLVSDHARFTVALGSVGGVAIGSAFLALLFSGSLVPESGFWLPFVLVVLSFSISTVLMVHAFSISDLSVVIPLMNFSTIFTLLLSPIILNEFPSTWQLVGIFIVIAGSYVLNASKHQTSLAAPIKAVANDKGARLILIVAAIWGIETIISKIGLRYSDPYTWAAYTRGAVSLIYLPLVLRYDKNFPGNVIKDYKLFTAMGLAISGAVIISNITLLKLDASVHSALMRNGTLFGILYGWWLFKEKNIGFRSTGALIMILGTLLIILA